MPESSPVQAIAPNPPVDTRVESLDAWWKDTAYFAARDPQEFFAQLPRLKREAGGSAASEPRDVSGARSLVLLMCEGIAHWAKRHNDDADLALKGALQTLESQMLPRASTAGMLQLVRKLIGFCHVNLGNVAHNRGDLAEALRAYLHAREIALFAGITKLLGTVIGNIAMVYGEAGMWEKQLEYSREARRIAEEVKDEIVVGHEDMNVAFAYRKMNDLAAARQACERALEISRRNGWKADELNSLVILASIELAGGKPADAISRLRAAEALSAEVDRPQYEAVRLIELGRSYLALGDLEGATAALCPVMEKYSTAMNFSEQAEARVVLARVRIAAGDFAAASSHANEALHLLARSGMPNEFEIDAHALLAEAARASSDWERACREEIARHEAYVRHFNQQADLRTRVLAVQHHIDIARAAAERERVERQRLEELLADVAARLKKADAMPRARNAEEITPEDLRPLGVTARESEVLLWVARGKTNEEIATILGRSLAVVKKHLKNIFEKLGVENRLAAATAVLQADARAARKPAAASRASSRRWSR